MAGPGGEGNWEGGFFSLRVVYGCGWGGFFGISVEKSCWSARKERVASFIVKISSFLKIFDKSLRNFVKFSFWRNSSKLSKISAEFSGEFLTNF